MADLYVIPDFLDPGYLREGNDIQRRCHSVLRRSGIMELLARYEPVVAGTIPIGIDIPGSDIDVLCRTDDLTGLEVLLRRDFGRCEGFRCEATENSAGPALVCSFFIDGMEIEVFAQDIPVTRQNGYRHMIAEYALLQIHGEPLRREVVRLKMSGIKTEPAFAGALGLPGDPYQAVLEKGRELGLFK